MHPQLFGGLALVAPVRDKHFAQKRPLELAYPIFIADPAGMHLRHKAFQFPSHVHLFLFLLIRNITRTRAVEGSGKPFLQSWRECSTRCDSSSSACSPERTRDESSDGVICVLTCRVPKNMRGSEASASHCSCGKNATITRMNTTTSTTP